MQCETVTRRGTPADAVIELPLPAARLSDR
jgi:hypothetical protein